MSHVHVKINFSYGIDSWNRCLSVHKRRQIRAHVLFSLFPCSQLAEKKLGEEPEEDDALTPGGDISDIHCALRGHVGATSRTSRFSPAAGVDSFQMALPEAATPPQKRESVIRLVPRPSCLLQLLVGNEREGPVAGVAIQRKETQPVPGGQSSSEFHQLNPEESAVTGGTIGEWRGKEAKGFGGGVQPMDLDPFGGDLYSPELTDQTFLR
jgi:hypothetical protein